MKIVSLYISEAHNYVGHHGQPAGNTPVQDVPAIECVANRGIKGDRYFDDEKRAHGQITFFAEETHRRLQCELGIQGPPDLGISTQRRHPWELI